MASFLSTIATWHPSAYYAWGIANTLVTPTILKYQNGSSALAKDFFPEVFEKVKNLRQDIVIYKAPNIPNACALGTNYGPDAVILFNEDLASTGAGALKYICKHELSHINTSDGFVASALAMTVSAVAAYAVPYLQSCLPWWATPISYGVPLITGSLTYYKAMVIFEARADRFASLHATAEELVGMERFLRGQIEVNKEMHPKYPQLFFIDGNSRIDFADMTHSSLTKRLEQITTECLVRGIPMEDNSNDEQIEKMQKIKEFHRNIYSKLFKLKVD